MWVAERPNCLPFILFSPISSTLAACGPNPFTFNQMLLLDSMSSLIPQHQSYLYPYVTGPWRPIEKLVTSGQPERLSGLWEVIVSVVLNFQEIWLWDYVSTLLGTICNQDPYWADVEHLHGQINHSFWSGRTSCDFRVKGNPTFPASRGQEPGNWCRNASL